MSLTQKKASGGPGTTKKRSKIAEWIDSLPEDEAQAARDMLADPEWATAALHRAFLEEGLSDVQYSAFRSFRATNYPKGVNL